MTDGAVLGMPAFAVEVQSPDEALADLRKKAMIYLRGGSTLVWLVLPRQRTYCAFWSSDVPRMPLHGGRRVRLPRDPLPARLHAGDPRGV
ncbi:MAG: Uma2 family endonuclease [Chloroflexi bacterium]|nr:Uma2 family endonuclease [Chloroflexota bacterium]